MKIRKDELASRVIALKNLLLIISSLVICLLLVEVCFRVAVARPQQAGWEDRPLFYYMPKSTQSLRGIHSDPEKSPGNFRVAVVGDSFSFAPYMQYDDAFPVRLERMLNLNGSEHKAEVINYSVPGYSTSHEVVEVDKAVNQEGADLVILQITLNDCERKPLQPTGIQVLKNPYAALEITPETHPILSKWKSMAYIVSRIHNKKMENVYRDYYLKLWEAKPGVDEFENSLKKIAEICAAKNIPLVAVTFPLFGYPLDKSYPFHHIHNYIHETLSKNGVVSLDLFEAFHGAPLDRLLVLPGKDFHPNEIAHRIAAEEIYAFLNTQTNTVGSVGVQGRTLIPEEFRISSLYRERTQIRLFPALREDPANVRSRMTPALP